MSKERDRLLYNEDGDTLDEICYTGDVHLEQEDDDAYYLRCGESLFNVYAEPFLTTDEEERTVVRARLVVSVRDLERDDYPLIQRHKSETDITPDSYEWYVTLKDDRRQLVGVEPQEPQR